MIHSFILVGRGETIACGRSRGRPRSRAEHADVPFQSVADGRPCHGVSGAHFNPAVSIAATFAMSFPQERPSHTSLANYWWYPRGVCRTRDVRASTLVRFGDGTGWSGSTARGIYRHLRTAANDLRVCSADTSGHSVCRGAPPVSGYVRDAEGVIYAGGRGEAVTRETGVNESPDARPRKHLGGLVEWSRYPCRAGRHVLFSSQYREREQ